MPKLFEYGLLNVRDVQYEVWKEGKEGASGRLTDFMLNRMKGNVFHVTPKPGETVAGKLYEVTEEQAKATDEFYTDTFKRIKVEDKDNGDFEVYVLAPPEEEVQVRVKKKSKKSRKGRK